MIQFHPYSFFLAASTVITLVVMYLVWRRTAHGTAALKGILAAMSIWGGCYTYTWLFTSQDLKVLFLKVMYTGVVLVPMLFLIFVLRITHRENHINFRNILFLLIEPVLILLLVWFAPQFMFGSINTLSKDGYAILQIQRGAGFWINTTYSYFLILVSMMLVFLGYRNANTFFKRQYRVILIGSLIPFAFSVFSQIYNLTVNEIDFLPASFGLTSVVYAFAIYRYQLTALVPVARSHLIESMSDGVLVLDAQSRIVDVNPAMQKLVGSDPTSFIGSDVGEVMKLWGQNNSSSINTDHTRTELRMPGPPPRYLDLRVSSLNDSEGNLAGRLFVFRDVTDRKEVEKDLRHAMDRLQTQLIEIGLLQSQLREQAIRDPLTNLFNRRYLEDTLERELARAAREDYPVCIVMMDIDHFKIVNDTYGHEAGDIVLKTLGDLVTRQCRQGDFVCRYGGEELILVMPNINIETAYMRASVIMEKVRMLSITYGRYDVKVTLSMGISYYPADGAAGPELIRHADRALYMAKESGRNQIVLFHTLNDPGIEGGLHSN